MNAKRRLILQKRHSLMRGRCTNRKGGEVLRTATSAVTLRPGRTRFCQLRARRMNGCNLPMCTSSRKKIGSLLRAKAGKKRRPTISPTASGPRMSWAKNSTKPVGVSPISWRRLLGDEHETLTAKCLTYLDSRNKNRAGISSGVILCHFDRSGAEWRNLSLLMLCRMCECSADKNSKSGLPATAGLDMTADRSLKDDQVSVFFVLADFFHSIFSCANCSAERIPFACLRNVFRLSFVQPAFIHSACHASILLC